MYFNQHEHVIRLILCQCRVAIWLFFSGNVPEKIENVSDFQ